MITIAAAVIPAASESPKPDPIIHLVGGPSGPGLNSWILDATLVNWSALDDRDLILIDTRGVGSSSPRLACPELDVAGTASFYSKPYVDSQAEELLTQAVAECRDRLSGEGVDVGAYTGAEGAADIDDLRRALGYDQWNLLAQSADGMLGLTYMRLFPDGIRSAIIDSGQSTSWKFFLDHIRGGVEILEKVFAGCASNAACDAAYPDLRSVFFNLIDELNEEPMLITIPDFEPEPVTFRIDGAFFYVDNALYGFHPGDKDEPPDIHWIIADLWRAGNGELAAVWSEWIGTGPYIENCSDYGCTIGKTISYLCHDLIGFITENDRAEAAIEFPELAPDVYPRAWDSVIGPVGCDIWGAGMAEAAQVLPFESPIPTLVLAGEFDRWVVPFVTRQIPTLLPSSYYYEFPGGSHLQLADYNFASECAREIADQFLESPDSEPDATCIESVAPFDFTPPLELHGVRAGRSR